jgi:hypothetical protein
MILGALSGLAGFALFLLAQLVVLRTRPAGAWLAWNTRAAAVALLLALIALAGLVQVVDVPALVQGGWMFGTIWCALTFVGLYVLYMPFYYVVMASLSVRTLILLRPGDLPRAQLAQHFTSEHFAAGRLDTMTANGFLARKANGHGLRYSLTPKGRALARIALAVKALWRLGPGG